MGATVALAVLALPDREPAVAPPTTAAGAPTTSAAPRPVPARSTPASRSSRPAVALPGALTMTPAQARADVAATRDCFAGFGPRTAPAGCRFGDAAGTKVVVLFGDSHADAWFPALDTVARRNHWQLWFWAKSGCGYADVPEFLTAYHRAYTECDDWRRSALARIDALPRVDLVVVGRSISYLGELLDPKGELLDRTAAAPVWSAGADRTLAHLDASARNVVVLRDVPRPGFDVPACVSQHRRDLRACAFPQARHVLPDRSVFDAERSVLAARGASVVDLTAAVCPGTPARP